MLSYGIAYALRWGVALIEEFLYWVLLTPSWENIFQVLEAHQEMESIRGLNGKEGQIMAYSVFCKILHSYPVFCHVKDKSCNRTHFELFNTI